MYRCVCVCVCLCVGCLLVCCFACLLFSLYLRLRQIICSPLSSPDSLGVYAPASLFSLIMGKERGAYYNTDTRHGLFEAWLCSRINPPAGVPLIAMATAWANMTIFADFHACCGGVTIDSLDDLMDCRAKLHSSVRTLRRAIREATTGSKLK